MQFSNPSMGKIGIEKAVATIKQFIKEQEGDYQLIIGSDSHFHRSRKDKKLSFLELVTAIIIHRKCHGGRFFWTRVKFNRFFSLKEKIYQETLASLEMAQRLMPFLKDLNGEFEKLEIHIDVGNNGPTRQMIKELVAMVVGNGFTAKTKPEAYGAFVVADKYT